MHIHETQSARLHRSKAWRRVLLISGVSLPVIAMTVGVAAQDAEPSETSSAKTLFQLEEVVVTAQKRSQSEQDVGITMAAFSENDLKMTNTFNTEDVAALVPNIQVNYGFGQVAFNIRGLGINEFSANLDSPVAVHVDEIYLSKNFMNNLVLFDVERVEALKGPQGTLFGRNTTGGSVNFYTRKPTEEFEAGMTVGYGNYEQFQAEAYISGPITDSVSGRISAMVRDQGEGFYENLTLGVDEGTVERFAIRGQLQWTGTNTDALLSFHYGEDESELPPYEGVGIFTPDSFAAGAPVFCQDYLDGTVTGASPNCIRGTDGLNPGDDDPFTSNGNAIHQSNNTSIGGSIRINHDFGNMTLTSISAIEHYERDLNEVSDGSPSGVISVFWFQDITQYSQELRLASNGGSRFNYVAGLYYQHDDFRNDDYLAVAGGLAPGFYTNFDQEIDAFAAFVHTDYAITDSLSLIAGLRYTHEDISIDGGTDIGTGTVQDGLITRPADILLRAADSALIPEGNSRSDQDLAFKVGLEYRPDITSDHLDDLLAYAHVSSAFRSGGFNAAFAGSQDAFTSLGPEEIYAYEAGFKTTWLDRRLQINGAAFYYDFRDGFINVDSDTAPIPITINAAGIDTYGAELDIRWLPAEGLDLQAGLGWLDAEIVSDITSAGTNLRGFSPVNSPEWSFNAAANYEFSIGDGLVMALNMSANWRDEQYLEAINAPANLEQSYWLVNARASVFSDEGWSLAFWANNLTNSEYRTYVNDLPGFGWLLNLYGPPRTYGLTFSYDF